MKRFEVGFAAAVVLVSVGLSAAAQSDVAGTYTGRRIGPGLPEFVTVVLQPGGRASVAIAPAPGARALVSTGSWRMLGSSQVMLNVAGLAGTGAIYLNRYDGVLQLLQQTFDVRRGLPLTLQQQRPIPGTYTAIRSSVGGYETLTLQLSPNQTASLSVKQSAPGAAPAAWTGTWQQLTSGDLQLMLTNGGKTARMVLYRSGPSVFTASMWDRAAWGGSSLVFTQLSEPS